MVLFLVQWFSGQISVADTKKNLFKQVYVLPKLRPSPQTFYSHHHQLVNRYEIAISRSPTRFLTDCVVLFPLYIFVLCLLPNVINVSCVHTRIYLVVFVMYILSYCYLYVLSRVMVSYTISVNKTMLGSSLSQMFDSFVCILCWTTLSIMFQFYWWRKRRSTRRNHRLIESQLPTLSHNNYITSVFHWNGTI